MSDPEMEYEEYPDESPESVSEDWLKEQKGYEEDLKNEKQRDQPETVKTWALEQAERIKEKDVKEENDIVQLKEKAQKELEEFYIKYNTDLTKRKEQRRNEINVNEEGGDGETNNHWMRISNILDLTSAKPNLNGKKDVSRMRSVILQLKNDPKI